MNRERLHFSREELEIMPSQKLDDILCAELESDEADRTMILTVIEILEMREKDEPASEHPKAKEAKALYQAWHDGARFAQENRPTRKYRVANAAVIVAIVLVIFMAVPKALGAENIFELIVKWTENFFAFDEPGVEVTEPQEEYVFQTDNPGLRQLYDTVADLGVIEPVVPQWLPEGYEINTLEVHEGWEGIKVHARFVRGLQEMSITIRILLDNPSFSYFKDRTDVEVYECGGVRHYIIENERTLQVVWHIENIECLFRTTDNCDLYQILGAIYKEE